LIWYARFDGEVTGLEPGLNANNVQGCFDLSNPIEVIRTNEGDCQANGGDIFGGPFEFMTGDGEADMIPAGAITVANAQGENFRWVVTDADGIILGLPPSFDLVNFDDAGPGVCLVWYLAFDGDIVGLEVDQDANDLQGCFDFSNPIEVIRTEDDGFNLGRVVISEIDASGQIEIFNGTDEMVPVGDWWLCNFPTYRQLSSLFVECGDLNLLPGEVVVVSGFVGFDAVDAELGLYETNSFGSSDAIRDYVEWGSSGHGRSQVAIDAGIWIADFFVTIPSDPGFSLQQSLNDDDELEWFDDESTFCMPNLFRSGTTSTLDPNDLAQISVFPNPASDYLQVQTSDFGSGPINFQLIDLNGRILLDQVNDFGEETTRLDLNRIPVGQYALSVRSASAFKVARVMIQR
ncbi:MAG: T9SS type A sorting domain-containing protein, partial [Bacteroidota bacterium]